MTAITAVSAAQPAKSPAHDAEATGQVPPRGELWPLEPLVDETFGVSTRALALRRDVRMYQWRATTDIDGSVSWSEAWLDEAVGTPPALRDAGHANPGRLPFHGVTWRATKVELDGHPVDASLYAHFEDWTPLAMDASSLPPNLAASFVSVDGCLYSGGEPAAPAIGDLRICWEILPAGPIEGAVHLQAGRWVADAAPVARGMQREDFALGEPGAQPDGLWKLLVLGLLLGCLLLLVLRNLLRNRGRS